MTELTGKGGYIAIDASFMGKLKFVNSADVATDDKKVYIEGLYELLSDFSKPAVFYGDVEVNVSVSGTDIYYIPSQIAGRRNYTRNDTKPLHITCTLYIYRKPSRSSGTLIHYDVDLCCDEKGAWLTRGE